MDVAVCKRCGKMYDTTFGRYCPNCVKLYDEEYKKVKDYLWDHKNSTMTEVAEACEVSTKTIKEWIREEKIEFKNAEGSGMFCESCGKAISSGKYCEACKQNLANILKEAIPHKIEGHANTEKPKDTTSKLRFIDSSRG